MVSDLGGGPDEGSHQQGGVQGVLPTLHQFLHPSPAPQHCAKQVLCPGAPEHLHLLTQSCLLWARSGVREQSLLLFHSEAGPQGRPTLALHGLGLAGPPSKPELALAFTRLSPLAPL